MHGLRDGQALDIGPTQHGTTLAGHLLGIEQRLEANVFRVGIRFEALQEVTQAAQAKNQRGLEKAMSKLEKALTRAEDKVRQYLGQVTQKSG